VIIAAYSIIGTLLPQGLEASTYLERYHALGQAIVFFQLDKVYSSFVFRTLSLLFCINLVGCTLKILPAQLKRVERTYFPLPAPGSENLYHPALDVEKLKQWLRRKRYQVTATDSGFKAAKHRIGSLGSSVTHLGVVVIMLGALVGGLLAEEGFFDMLPGDIRAFGTQGFSLRLDDFFIQFREDNSVEQYYSQLTVMEAEQAVRSGTIWVNQPLKHRGIEFFQTSYGWASELNITDAAGNLLASQMLRDNETYFYQPAHLSVYLYGFFPDMVVSETGQPLTMTEQKNNPFYAVILHQYGQHIGSYVLEPGQPLELGELNIVFPDSVLYTGITFRKDVGYPLVLLGFLLLLLGLFMSFYTYPKYILLDGESLRVVSRKNSWGLNYQLQRYVAQVKRRGSENS
jgi:cytochrome c biogenesis protein